MRATGALAAVVGLYLLLTVPAAIYNPMASFDEAWYASVSRNVLHTGDWWTFYYNGAPFWEKPPLTLWGTSLSFKLFGVSDFAARLTALACGALLVVAVFAFCRRTGTTALGVLAALLLLTAQDFVRFAAKGQMDVPVALFITCHLLMFWKGLEKPHWHLLGGVFLGLAIATKNQAGLLGSMIQVVYLLVTCDGRAWRQWQWYASGLIGLIVAVPWFAHQYWCHADAFTSWFWYKNFGMYREQLQQAGDSGRLWGHYLFYPRYLFSRHLLLALAALLGLGWAIRQSLVTKDRLPAFFAVWIVFVPAIFALGGAEHYWYLVPMYPAVALLLALAVQHSSLWKTRPRWVLGTVALWAVILQVSYYVPPPKQTGLWAAANLAAAVRGTGRTDVVHLLHEPGRNKHGIFEPAAHYYFDRKVVTMKRVDDLENRLAEPTLFVGRADIIDATYRTHIEAHGSLETVATDHETVLLRFTPTVACRPRIPAANLAGN